MEKQGILVYSVSIGLRQFGYHDPRVSFPTDKMIPGVFLGIAEIQVTGFFTLFSLYRITSRFHLAEIQLR